MGRAASGWRRFRVLLRISEGLARVAMSRARRGAYLAVPQSHLDRAQPTHARCKAELHDVVHEPRLERLEHLRQTGLWQSCRALIAWESPSAAEELRRRVGAWDPIRSIRFDSIAGGALPRPVRRARAAANRPAPYHHAPALHASFGFACGGMGARPWAPMHLRRDLHSRLHRQLERTASCACSPPRMLSSGSAQRWASPSRAAVRPTQSCGVLPHQRSSGGAAACRAVQCSAAQRSAAQCSAAQCSTAVQASMADSLLRTVLPDRRALTHPLRLQGTRQPPPPIAC